MLVVVQINAINVVFYFKRIYKLAQFLDKVKEREEKKKDF